MELLLRADIQFAKIKTQSECQSRNYLQTCSPILENIMLLCRRSMCPVYNYNPGKITCESLIISINHKYALQEKKVHILTDISVREAQKRTTSANYDSKPPLLHQCMRNNNLMIEQFNSHIGHFMHNFIFNII